MTTNQWYLENRKTKWLKSISSLAAQVHMDIIKAADPFHPGDPAGENVLWTQRVLGPPTAASLVHLYVELANSHRDEAGLEPIDWRIFMESLHWAVAESASDSATIADAADEDLATVMQELENLDDHRRNSLGDY